MFADLGEVSWLLGYKRPATLYRLLKAGLLDDYIEYFRGQRLLRMNLKGKSPLHAERVRSLVNFKGEHEMFMFNPREEASIKRIHEYDAMKKDAKNLSKKIKRLPDTLKNLY
tara:strand:+ start:613 stop:948 length:336 start_codon:yes stop_codon:yes gene_type:complete